MKIGVIGIGNIGGTLARKLVAAGHQVRVANSKGSEDVRPFADEIGAEAVYQELLVQEKWSGRDGVTR